MLLTAVERVESADANLVNMIEAPGPGPGAASSSSPPRGRYFVERVGCVENKTIISLVGMYYVFGAVFHVLLATIILLVAANEKSFDRAMAPVARGETTTLTWGEVSWTNPCFEDTECVKALLAETHEDLEVAATFGVASLAFSAFLSQCVELNSSKALQFEVFPTVSTIWFVYLRELDER